MYKGKSLFHLITPHFPSSISDLSTMVPGRDEILDSGVGKGYSD